LKEATVIARIAEQGVEAVGSSPEEFAAFIRAEAEKYARIVKATGVRANP
jgi:tripartite-type tricarboxylate transporter receptor subunit TctC